MNQLSVKLVNAETGQEVIREMNEEELADLANEEAKEKAIQKAKKQKAIDKAALLEKLGISEDEAKLLLS